MIVAGGAVIAVDVGDDQRGVAQSRLRVSFVADFQAVERLLVLVDGPRAGQDEAGRAGLDDPDRGAIDQSVAVGIEAYAVSSS